MMIIIAIVDDKKIEKKLNGKLWKEKKRNIGEERGCIKG